MLPLLWWKWTGKRLTNFFLLFAGDMKNCFSLMCGIMNDNSGCLIWGIFCAVNRFLKCFFVCWGKLMGKRWNAWSFVKCLNDLFEKDAAHYQFCPLWVFFIFIKKISKNEKPTLILTNTLTQLFKMALF